ncbi:Predicted RNA-binding protein, contains TRAM domain [Haladaptatus litoreus]|uniref:Predicted RNA-binding protein, contains TRAM domain n=1 Tax=Haladaptatus litoreus TaxID=553468 RepID=A0A1N7EIU8_9EURY|nr:TRAM domain-containing protein [Haladaptatus litoreus]SIR87898.1 Predicted RNA-binding protein, contains TRAM domain [Haladaptatus litoreus]
MEIPDELLCLFSECIEEQKETYTIMVPKEELTDGVIQENGTYRVALIKPASNATDSVESTQPHDDSGPPVEEGERRNVEIEGIGDQGDGIAKVERGYIVIVPDTEQHERVGIEITDVTPTVAFAEVVDRELENE